MIKDELNSCHKPKKGSQTLLLCSSTGFRPQKQHWSWCGSFSATPVLIQCKIQMGCFPALYLLEFLMIPSYNVTVVCVWTFEIAWTGTVMPWRNWRLTCQCWTVRAFEMSYVRILSLVDELESYAASTDSMILACYQHFQCCSLAEAYHRRLDSLWYDEGHSWNPISLHWL